MQKKAIILLIIIYCLLVYAEVIPQSKEGGVFNSFDVLISISQKISTLESNFNNDEFNFFIKKIDAYCDGEIRDTIQNDISLVQNAIYRINHLDVTLPELTLRLTEYLPEIIINEFRFRTIVAIQHRLEILHFHLPDIEKLTSSAEFITFNIELGHTKTNLVNRQIQILSQCKNESDKLRGWIAITRMLNEIDIPQSESGNQFVQRSPYGLIIRSGVINQRLSELNVNETNIKVKEYSSSILAKINSADSKYKEVNDTIVYEYNAQGKSDNTKTSIEALAFFDKAFLSDKNIERIVLYTKAIERDSAFAAAYNNRGICYYLANEYLKAIDDFNKVLKLDTYYTSIYTNFGLCYFQLGNYQKSIKYFTQAQQSGEKDLIIFTTRGTCYQKLKNFIDAINDFTHAIKIDSTSYTAYSNRAECYKQLKKTNDVIKDYKKLIELKPENSTLYYNLGCIYFNQKDWKQAVKYWEQGLKVNPDDPNIGVSLPKAKKYLVDKM